MSDVINMFEKVISADGGAYLNSEVVYQVTQEEILEFARQLTQPSDGAFTNEGAEPVAKAKPTLWMVRIPDEPGDPENSPAEYEYAGSEWQRDGLLKNKGSEVVQVYCNYPPAQAPVVLPKRAPAPGNGEWHSLYPKHLVWNWCLDEFKRLNPGIDQ